MIEFRCRKCNSLLLKEEVLVGTIEVKCHSCNTFNTLSVDKYSSKLDNTKSKFNNIKVKTEY